MSASGPPTLEALVDRLGQLPGIGRRSAERLAFWLLRASSDEALGLAEAIRAVKEDLVSCRVCGHLGAHGDQLGHLVCQLSAKRLAKSKHVGFPSVF